MKQLSINYPDDLAEAAQVSPAALESELRLMAAVKLFELGRLSSGKAAELAGLTRAEFLEACGRVRIAAYNYPDTAIEQELSNDVATAREAGL